jgi:hypothetical protein
MLLSGSERNEAHHFFAKAGFNTERKRGFVKYRREFAIDEAGEANISNA